jgi:uncharacterized protein DUF4331
MTVRRRTLAALAGLGCAAAIAVPSVLLSSDHQDTAEVELNQQCDINDVYAFPGSSAGRIAIAVTTASPIAPGVALGFDNDKLYQIKIDNDSPRDGVEDYVLQFKFSGTGAAQMVTMYGPVPPRDLGTRNRLTTEAATLSGAVNTVLGSSSGVQLFAGLRDDPFFLDLAQFFQIVPDRRPVTGPLSIPPVTPAGCWRDPGVATDYLLGLNTNAIVVEMPASMLTAGGSATLGIWATLSR